jgi:hypothetical protein
MRITRVALAALWLTVAAAPAFAARSEQPGREMPILQRIVSMIVRMFDDPIIPRP